MEQNNKVNQWILDKDFKLSFIDKEYLWKYRECLMDLITRLPIPVATYWNDYKKIIEYYVCKKYLGYSICDIEINPEEALWEFYSKKIIPIAPEIELRYIKNIYIDVKTFLELIQNENLIESYIEKYKAKIIFFFNEKNMLLIELHKHNKTYYYACFTKNDFKEFIKNYRKYPPEEITKNLIIDYDAIDFLNELLEEYPDKIFYQKMKEWIENKTMNKNNKQHSKKTINEIEEIEDIKNTEEIDETEKTEEIEDTNQSIDYDNNDMIDNDTNNAILEQDENTTYNNNVNGNIYVNNSNT